MVSLAKTVGSIFSAIGDVIASIVRVGVDIVTSIVQLGIDLLSGIVNLGIDIVTGIVDLGVNLVQALVDLGKAIIDGLLDGIKKIFVPDMDEINNDIAEMKQAFESKFGVSTDIGSIFGKSESISDIQQDGITYVSMKYVRKAVDYFRPYIRGFIVFMMIIYNLNQILCLIGQAPITLGAYLKANSSDTKE